MPFNTSSNTDTSSNSNNSLQNITSQEAKEIAKEVGLRTGEPNSGTIEINNVTINVWIVSLYKQNKLVKEVYVNKEDGNIVTTKEFN